MTEDELVVDQKRPKTEDAAQQKRGTALPQLYRLSGLCTEVTRCERL